MAGSRHNPHSKGGFVARRKQPSAIPSLGQLGPVGGPREWDAMSKQQRYAYATRDLVAHMRTLGRHNANVALNTAKVAAQLGLSRSTVSTVYSRMSKQEGSGLRMVTAGLYEYRWAEDAGAESGAQPQTPGSLRRMGLFLDVVRWLQARPMELHSIHDIADSLDAVHGSVATVLKRAVDDHPELGIEVVNRSVYRYNPALDTSLPQNQARAAALSRESRSVQDIVAAHSNGSARSAPEPDPVPQPLPELAALLHPTPADVAAAARPQQRQVAEEDLASAPHRQAQHRQAQLRPGQQLRLEYVYDLGNGKALLKDPAGQVYELRLLS